MTTEELAIILTAEIGELKKELNKGKKEVENFSKKSKTSFKEVNDAMQKVGDVSKTALKVTAGALAGAATALVGLSAATAEYRNNQAKLNSAFETAGASAGTAKQTYNDLYRVLGEDDTAVEAANHLAQMTTNQEELSQWTNICQGVYATFGASLPIEGLTEAANETAKVGTVTGSLADALNWAGISEDAFNEKLEKCNSEAEREKLIRETLNGVYDKASKNYEKNAAGTLAQNEAQAKLNESMGKLGEAMAPINTMLAEFATEILDKITPGIQEFAEKHGPTVKEVLSGIAKAIGDVLTWITENWEFVSTLAAIILGIAAALSVVSTVMGIVNAVTLASPVTWIVLGIVAAVAALVAIIVLCVKHWDEIKAAVGNAMDAIGNAVKTGIDKIKGFFDKIVNFVKENWQGLLLLLLNPFAGAFKLIYDNCEGFRNTIDNLVKQIKEFFANLWQGIKNIFSSVGTWFRDKFNAARDGIKNAFSSVVNFFSGIWTSIKNIFSNVGSAIGNAITNTVKSAINGVLSTATKIINGFISAINIAMSVINAIPGVNIKKLSKLSVPKLAEGGIVDSATLAVIGEQGKEAVVPLENNTEWIDKLADRIAAKTGGSTPIVLNVDGKTFAQTAINTMNELTRQTGSLKLNVY